MDCFKWLFQKNQTQPVPVENSSPVRLPAIEPKAHDHQDLLDLYAKAEIRVSRLGDVKYAADRIKLNQERYSLIEKQTGVPWYVIGAIHHKEASLSFNAYLGNGERIIGTGRKSSIVPSGRGPFATFEEGAIDALGNQKGKDWSLGGMLHFLEAYNGMGYRKHGIPTPYLFAGTTVYEKGGFPRDHFYDPEHVVKNVGCAAIFKHLGIS